MSVRGHRLLASLALLAAGCLAGCAHGVVGPAYEGVEQFQVQRGELSLSGLAVVRLEDDRAVLQALTPGGVALFTLTWEGGRRRVEAPDDAWADVLERLPFERDLSLVHRWSCGGARRCRVGGGRMVERIEDGVVERRWRGPGGPARARIEGRRAEVRDLRRGYRLVVVVPEGG